MKKNGDLATIADQATNDFVTNSFPISFTFWIGGVRKSGKWTWADGTLWNFDLNEQNDSGDDYLVMWNTNKWGDCRTSCKFYFLCQY